MPYLPAQTEAAGESLTTTATEGDVAQATNVNQPGEMVNPAGEAVPNSSSSGNVLNVCILIHNSR